MAELETEVKLLKKELQDQAKIHDRLDVAIEKLTDVSNSIHRMLAVHEEKLARQEEAIFEAEQQIEVRRTEVLKQITELHSRITTSTKEFLKKFGGKDGFKCNISMPENNTQDVISAKDLRGKWHDIVINIKWSRKKDGYFKQWINGKLVYHYLVLEILPCLRYHLFSNSLYIHLLNQTFSVLFACRYIFYTPSPFL